MKKSETSSLFVNVNSVFDQPGVRKKKNLISSRCQSYFESFQIFVKRCSFSKSLSPFSQLSELVFELENYLSSTLGMNILDLLLMGHCLISNKWDLFPELQSETLEGVETFITSGKTLGENTRHSIIGALENRHADLFKHILSCKSVETLYDLFLKKSKRLADFELEELDKKKERSLVFSMKKSPVLVHLSSVILLSQISGAMIHLPSKLLPHLISSLEHFLKPDSYEILTSALAMLINPSAVKKFDDATLLSGLKDLGSNAKDALMVNEDEKE